MDKRWIDLPNRMSREYIAGIDQFLTFAYSNRHESLVICCPCRNCGNRYNQPRMLVREHLISNGFLRNYKKWVYHGESYSSLHGGQENQNVADPFIGDDMVGMVCEAMGIPYGGTGAYSNEPNAANQDTGPNEETKAYLKLMENAQTELYPGCRKFTSLSFLVRLLHMKVLGHWTDDSTNKLLQFLNEAFPEGVKLPNTYHEAKKITEDLGFTYKTVDACPKHCMLFRGEDAKLNECAICGESRWKENNNALLKNCKQVAAQQVRYFPLKPTLQRLFICSKTAKLMKWHVDDHIDDGVDMHPADSPAWKHFDQKHPTFASDSRNVRLGLASDGFNPFRSMNIVHSTWPVVLITYNLPPWLCMKQPFLILSMLIDGPKAPGDKIDVYLQLLIEELKELWREGVPTFDASTNQMFKLRATLLGTINDLPAYANLSGWSTKGQFGCPPCNIDIQSSWLKHFRKHVFVGHRRFLPDCHRFRRDKVSFDGNREYRKKPKLLSGSEILLQLESNGILTQYKREDLIERHKRSNEREKAGSRDHNWRKKSIFWELEYWVDLLIRHYIDAMHTEKNFCDNILWTILGIVGKSKDNVNARRDLQEKNIRKPLHLQSRESGKAYMPPAQFTMSKDEKDLFLKVLKEVRSPDGYASNISRRVRTEDRTISGLKSHDSHILIQQLIPVAIRKSLPKNVVEALIEVSNFFRQIWSKQNRASDLENIRDRMAITLCHLEKIFPPSFFDIMEHLPIHLADEALIAGPVQFRSMYPIERFLLTLKQYVRNRARPEASIAKGYLMEQCMNFCAQYLDDVETKSNRPIRNDDGGDIRGRALGETTTFHLQHIEWMQAHRYVLFNTAGVAPFISKHLEVLKSKMPRVDDHQIQREHFEQFHTWFMEHVRTLRSTNNATLSEEIIGLAKGPQFIARRYKGYIINGNRFRVKAVDDCRTTQNSGVALKADTMSYASRKDRNPRVGAVYYYGRLTDVVEIQYTNDIKFVLFKCDWIDNVHGKKEDVFKFTLVNFNRLLYREDRPSNEPFILASQAEQVWYIPDPKEPEWEVVMKMSQRGFYDLGSHDPQTEPFMSQELEENIMIRDEEVGWVREGAEGETVDLMEEETVHLPIE